MTRTVMKEFVLEEISVAREPAQAGALAVIRKSTETETNTMHKSFDNRVAELRKQGMSSMGAMEQARHEMPDVMKAENNLSIAEHVEPAPVRIAKSASVIKFEKRVAEIRGAENITKTQALVEARKRYPDEFEAYQNG